MTANARRGWLAGVLFVAAACFHGSYAFHGITLFDEGVLVDGAMRVLDGEVLGRDTFAPYGPATYWLLAPCFELFGPSLATLRAVTVGLQAGADTALFLAVCAMASLPAALLAAALLAVAHGSLHKSFLLLATLLVIDGARRLGDRGRPRAPWFAGAAAGAAFLFRHDAGAFGASALLVALLVDRQFAPAARWRRIAGLAGGFLLVVGPAALVLVAAGLDLQAWWDHEWQRIAVQERIDLAFPWPWDGGGFQPGRAALAAALVATPLVHASWGGAALLRSLRRRGLEHDTARVAIALFGLLLLNQARLIPSANHLFQAFAPLAVALADLCGRRREPEHRGFRLARLGALALLVGAVTFWAANGREGPYSGTFRQRIDGAVRLDLPAAGVWLEPGEARLLASLVAAVQERVPEAGSIVTSPGCPLIGFLAGRRLALPYAEPAYYYANGGDERFQREAIAALERRRPEVFVHDPRPAATFTLEAAAPLVADYLARNYRAAEQIGRFTLLVRRP